MDFCCRVLSISFLLSSMLCTLKFAFESDQKMRKYQTMRNLCSQFCPFMYIVHQLTVKGKINECEIFLIRGFVELVLFYQ
jgi:hypothetical protein